MNRTTIVILLATMLLTFFACQPEEEEKVPDVSSINVSVEVVRLDQKIARLQTVEEAMELLQAHSTIAKEFFGIKEPSQLRYVAERLLAFAQHPATDTLMSDIDKIYGDFEPFRQEFVQAFRYVKYYFPDFRPPIIYTVVTGFLGDVFISKENNIIVIGLDYMAGNKATYRPPAIPNYILRRNQPQYIVPNTLLLFSANYIDYDAKDKSMLADMIFHGKALYFVDKMLPHTPDTLIIGYTGQELADCYANEERVWRYFVQENLFFETSFERKRKFVEESPRVIEIGDNCPGRIGRWLGWQIVKSFQQKHPTLTLDSLLKIKDANLIFQASKYKPKS